LEIIKNPEEYISGYPLHTWYRGIVEDNQDPELRGRVRVRVESVYRAAQGKNTSSEPDKAAPTSLAPHKEGENKGDSVKTEELPWADVVSHGQANKIGVVNIPCINDAVIVVFEFGRPEFPLVIGGWWGEHTDETDKKTKSEVPLAALGGDQTGETGNDNKGNDTGVTSVIGATLDEPANPYAASYPNNQVLRTSSGHLVELDNTEGSERINIVHKSGTWIEFHPDGSLVFGVQGRRYTLIEQNDEQHIKGDRHIVVDGDDTKKVTGNIIEEITGDFTVEITGDGNTNVTGMQTLESTGTTTIKSTGDMTVQSVGGASTVKAMTKVTVSAPTVQITGVIATPATGGGEVVTTLTHPVDYITGIPILGVAGFKVI
jgi:type VI secretion system secreted protein VgrG